MNKDDRNHNVKKERFIMISTSALVLTTLIASGAYVRNRNRESLDQGYAIDFSVMENQADQKLREITQNGKNNKTTVKSGNQEAVKVPGIINEGKQETAKESLGEGKQETAKKSQSESKQETAKKSQSEGKQETAKKSQSEAKQDAGKVAQGSVNEEAAEIVRSEVLAEDVPLQVQEVFSNSPIISEELHFSPEKMIKPVTGEPLIEYSMDHSVYFATLDQYKRNPAVIYGASQGESVNACCRGRVMSVKKDAVLGSVLVLDLGDGYQATYGQLENIETPIGSVVEVGSRLATVAAPTKYYSVEGSNLYFKLTKDGESVDPSQYFH